MILNVGSGRFPLDGAINLDIADVPGVDIVHDLDVAPWPFDDDQFSLVRGVQVFEHVDDPILFMCEAWRVLRPGGELYLTVPHYQSANSFTDPTHRRHCTLHTWDYWCPGTPLNGSNGASYGGDRCQFERTEVVQDGEDIRVRLHKIARPR